MYFTAVDHEMFAPLMHFKHSTGLNNSFVPDIHLGQFYKVRCNYKEKSDNSCLTDSFTLSFVNALQPLRYPAKLVCHCICTLWS